MFQVNLDNPGLSPSDREVLAQLREQAPPINNDAEKLLLGIPLDPFAERFLQAVKRRTFVSVTDMEIATFFRECDRSQDDEERNAKWKHLNAIWRATSDVVVALTEGTILPEIIDLLGMDWWSDDRDVRIWRAMTKYRLAVNGDHN